MHGVHKQQGSAVVGVLLAMMLIGLVGATAAAVGRTELATGHEFKKGVAAQFLAEAGALRAITRLKTDAVFLAQTSSGHGVNLQGTMNEGADTLGSYTVHVSGSGVERTIVAQGLAGLEKPASRHVVVTGKISSGVNSTRIFTPAQWSNIPPWP